MVEKNSKLVLHPAGAKVGMYLHSDEQLPDEMGNTEFVEKELATVESGGMKLPGSA